MRHDWQPGLCLTCGFYCDQCNDCKCPGKGWKRYTLSSCPNFDTHAGRDRPNRADVEYKHWVDNITYLYGPGSKSYQRGLRRKEHMTRSQRYAETRERQLKELWTDCENPY